MVYHSVSAFGSSMGTFMGTSGICMVGRREVDYDIEEWDLRESLRESIGVVSEVWCATD